MRPDPPALRNVRSCGPLIAAKTDNGVAIFSGYDLAPGDVRSGGVTIRNGAGVGGRLTLAESDASSAFGAGELTLTIDDVTDDDEHVCVFGGEIGGLPAAGIDLGCIGPGRSRQFRFLIMLDLNSSGRGADRGAGGVYEWSFASEGAALAADCASSCESR